MSWLLNLSLIQLFLVYLTLAFLIGTALRIRDYRHALALILRAPSRWPRLVKLVKEHHSILLTWHTVLPLFLSLGLILAHQLTSNFVWPEAASYLKIGRLLPLWPALFVVAPTGAVMIGLDVYSFTHISPLDRPLLEKYFDQAEYWLKPWTAPVVRIFTFGYINPRKMVTKEVRSALEAASRIMSSAFWWASLQTVSRLAFGLALWGTYAVAMAAGWAR
ncbi:MAG TPA: hypothetical protein VMS17_16795 [Gemmataceae bacterium]|nr:hypothetical protein [Gemmataceae bacterium]